MASLVNHFSFSPLFSYFYCVNLFSLMLFPPVRLWAILLRWKIAYAHIDSLVTDASIVMFLSVYHGIPITVRQLKYLINIKYNLRRRNNESAAHKILQVVRYELNGPGCLMGYRFMTRCLRTREDLRAILQESEAKLEMKIFNPSSIFVWR